MLKWSVIALPAWLLTAPLAYGEPADEFWSRLQALCGSAGVQYFPADEATRQVIEAAFSNVWTMTVVPGERFTYGLWRLGTPRVFRIDFDLGRPVEPPQAPWGWEKADE